MSYNVTSSGGICRISMKAHEALAANRVVVLDSTVGEVKYPGATTDTPFGVTESAADANEAVTILTGTGAVEITALNGVAVGARCSIGDTSGRVDDAATDTVATKFVGIALDTVTSTGEVATVLINLPGLGEDGGAS